MIGMCLQALVGADVARQVEAVHARHFDIDQHDVGHDVEQLFERFDAVLGGQHLIAFARQQAPGDLAHGQRIVDHHHRRQRRRRPLQARFNQARPALRNRCVDRRATAQGDRIEDQHDLTVTEHGRTVDPITRASCGPMFLTTISSLPINSSTCTAIAACTAAQQQGPVLAMLFGKRLGSPSRCGRIAERIVMPHPFAAAGIANARQRGSLRSSTCSIITEGMA
jgi:hypothetical protein